MKQGRAATGIRLHLSLLLLSAALIGFQLEQMQLLAMAQWHHFAYLVISVALLGFGASGTCIALFRPLLLRHLEWLLPVLMFGCALLMAIALPLSSGLTQDFDIFLLFVEPMQSVSLILGQGVYLLVFFFGAFPMGLVFIAHSERINSLYSANLIGSGLGGAGAVLLMTQVLPQSLPAITALLPWVGGCLVIAANRRAAVWCAAVLSLAGIVALIVRPPEPQPSAYKDIERMLDIPGAAVVAIQPDPQGLVQKVRAPSLRYAPGLSLTYDEEVPEVKAIVLTNGDWFDAVSDVPPRLQQATTFALPYAIGQRKRVLLLGAGTGAGIAQARANGAETIIAVEPHKHAARMGWVDAGWYRADTKSRKQVGYAFLHPRTWIARTQEQHDLITLPIAGRFGGGSGLTALQEQYLYTEEAIALLWEHLTDDGILQISTWLDTPSRSTLRLAATIREVLEGKGVDPTMHTAAIGNWNLATFVVKRSPLTSREVQQVRLFCTELQFDPMLLPGLRVEERQRYHAVADPDFFKNLDMLASPAGRQELYAGYAFDIRPVRDERPFFSQFLRWQSLPLLASHFGERTMPFLELGYLVVAVSFFQVVVAAVVLILLPLLRLGRPVHTGLQRWVFPYFAGLGIGFMFFEIVLIHKLTLYFGNPLYAAAVGICSLLVFSGLGSRFSVRLAAHDRIRGLSCLGAGILLVFYSQALSPLLTWAMVGSMAWKILFFLLVVAPAGFIMGVPFPLGLAHLAGQSKRQAAWAWGINGCSSVVSAGLATIIVVEFGFSVVLVVAGGAYMVAAVSAFSGEALHLPGGTS